MLQNNSKFENTNRSKQRHIDVGILFKRSQTGALTPGRFNATEFYVNKEKIDDTAGDKHPDNLIEN